MLGNTIGGEGGSGDGRFIVEFVLPSLPRDFVRGVASVSVPDS